MNPTQSIFTIIANRIYLAGLFLLPTAVVLSSTIPLQSTKMMIGAVGLIGAVAFAVFGAFNRGGLTVPLNWMLLGVWLLPVVYALSAGLNSTLQWSLIGGGLDTDTVFFMALLSLAASVPLYLFSSKSDYVRAFFVMLVASWIVGLFHLLRLLFGAEAISFGIFTNPLFTPLGKWNDVSIFFGLVSLLTLVALESIPLQTMHRAVLTGTLVVSLFFVAVVNFIPVWAVLAVISLGIVLYRVLLATDAQGRFSIAGTLVFVVAVVFLLFSTTLGGGASRMFGVEQIEARPSWDSTMQVAVQALGESPIVGSGPNTFLFAWDKFRPALINNSIFWNADFTSGVGLVPTSIVTTGLVGALAWLFLFGVFLLAGIRGLLMRPPTDPSAYHLAVASFVGALYMLIMSVVYLPSPQLMIIGFAILGMFAAIYHKEYGGRTLDIEFRAMPRLGFVAVLGLALTLVVSAVTVYGAATVFASSVQFERASRAAQVDGKLDDAVTYINSAIKLYPEDRYYRLAALVHLAKLNALLNAPDSLPQEEAQVKFQEELGASVESGLASVRLNQRDYRNWQTLGAAYQTVVPLNIEGSYDAAVSAFESAAALNPMMPTIPFALGQLELAKGTKADGRTLIEKSLTLKQDYIPALLLLAQIELADGNLKEAIKRAESASVFEPSNPVTRFQVGVLKFEDNDIKGAEEAFGAALALAPDYSNARYYLGRVYFKKGSPEAAVKEFKEVQRLNPENTDVATVIAAIEAGKDPFAPIEPTKK